MTESLFRMMDEHSKEPCRRGPKPSGYAGRPGTGPAGETCKTCLHAVCKRLANRYWKCAVYGRVCGWTGGRKTDILLRSPACERWERKEG